MANRFAMYLHLYSMKRLIVIFHICFLLAISSRHSYGQSLPEYKQLKEIEQAYLNSIAKIEFTVHRKTYSISQAEQVEDSMIAEMSNKPPVYEISVDYYLESFSKDYFEILQRISKFIPLQNDTLNIAVDSIFRSINALKSFKEKAFASFYFGSHFDIYGRNISNKYGLLINESVKLKTNNIEDITSFDRALAYETKFENLPSSLAIYETTYDYYDSFKGKSDLADIETNLANLYMMREEQFEYTPNYMKHLGNAGSYYDELNDTLNALRTCIKLSMIFGKYLDSSKTTPPEDLIVANKYILLKGRPYDAYKNAIVDSFLKNKKRSYEFATLQAIAQIDQNKQYEVQFTCWKYSILGDYFLRTNKTNAALSCYNTALLSAVTINQFLYSLYKLSNYYLEIHNYEKSLKYINAAIAVTSKQATYDLLCGHYIERGNILNASHKFRDAIANFIHGISLCDSINMKHVPKSTYQLRAFKGLYSAYDSLGKFDSSAYYKDKYNDIRLSFINELDRLNSLEYKYDFYRKNKTLAKREKELSWANTIIWALIGFISFGFFLFWITIVIKNRTVRKVRGELNGIAVGKHHNLKGNFTTTNLLLFNKKYDTALNYTQASSDYYNTLIDMEDVLNNKWTLQQEKNILAAFSSKEKIYRDNFEFKFEYGSLKIENMLFIPEVLTTMLDNSIRHGFDPKKRGYYFRVEVSKKGKFLYFEVSDNGKFAGIEKYFRKETPNKGLNFTRKRIRNELSSKIRFSKSDDFIVSQNKDKGTTIKFRYPYALSA